jgi:PKHD-type hydroxylase
MILCISDVLTAEELVQINQQLATAEFTDGSATAGWHARLVKNNDQLPSDSPVLAAVRQLISQALQRHPLLQMAVRPRLIRPVMISRYTTGMAYGTHIDNALMQNPTLRSDVSLTLFLNDPQSYEGGELVMESTQGEQAFKLEAGSAIAYPSTALHRVETVTQGMRLAAVTWIQSFVRDAEQRELLFDLQTAYQGIFQKYGKTAEFDLLTKTHTNLLRKWVEL